jgi:hypothetical protein
MLRKARSATLTSLEWDVSRSQNADDSSSSSAGHGHPAAMHRGFFSKVCVLDKLVQADFTRRTFALH